MSSFQRSLSEGVLVLDLQEERRKAVMPGGHERSGRALVRNGSLRVVMVVLAPLGELPEHHAEGPIAVQPLQGRVRFIAGDKVYDIGPGELLSAEGGIRHSVSSKDGATFLLTVVVNPDAEA
ncbi:MAG: hypothetical protein ABI766_13820 [Gemmatimonadales bacterium]